MKCDGCGSEFNDGVQCSMCRRQLDFGCAQITETGWRKLGTDRRSAWKCSSCRSSPIPSPIGDFTSLDTILKELRELKSQLVGLPALFEDVRAIKDELRELKRSNDYLSGRIDDLQNRVAKVEDVKEVLNSLESEVFNIKSQFSAMDQRSRLNNVEIKGVPLKKDENIFSIVESISKKINVDYSKAQINFLHRSPLHGTKEKSIIVSFLNRYTKEEFVAAARACKALSASDLGYQNSNQRIYVNDHLNAYSKALLNKVKAKAKDARFNYVWVKHGKIHVRKNDTSPVLIMMKEEDLNKIT